MPSESVLSRTGEATGTAVPTAIRGEVKILARELVPSEALCLSHVFAARTYASKGVLSLPNIVQVSRVYATDDTTYVVEHTRDDWSYKDSVGDTMSTSRFSFMPVDSVSIGGKSSLPDPARAVTLLNELPEPLRKATIAESDRIRCRHGTLPRSGPAQTGSPATTGGLVVS